MLVRIDDFDNDRMPHKLVFTDLDRLLREQRFPRLSAWQTVSRDKYPAMQVKLQNPPPSGTLREIPDELIQLDLRPHPCGHPTLNGLLVFRGLINALADLKLTSAERRENGRGTELATRVTSQVAP